MKQIIITVFVLASAISWAITFDEATDIVIDKARLDNPGVVRVYGLDDVINEGTAIPAWHDSITAPDDGYLFLVDPTPAANWEHNCTWAFVSIDGDLTEYKMTTPPGDAVFLKMEDLTNTEYFDGVMDYDEMRKVIRERQRDIFGKDFYEIDRSQFKGQRYVLLISGGANQGNNHIRYWNDIAFIYRCLINYYGYDKSEIVVCMSDGDNPAPDRSNGTDSPLDLDGDNIDDYDLDATYATVTAQLQHLVDNVGAGDQVFVFTTDHGGGGSNDVYLNLWNSEQLPDEEFATYMDNLPSSAIKVVTMEQCYSGGFIDDIQSNGTSNVIISTAATGNELSWAMPPDYVFDTYVFHWTSAVNFAGPGFAGYSDDPVDADTDDNDLCEMDEAYIYAEANDQSNEHPQYYDSSSIGDAINLFGDISGVLITFQSIEHEDPAPGGNGDGIYTKGETVEVTVTAGNIGQTTATNVTATLTTNDADLTIVNGSAPLPDIPQNGFGSNSTPLTFSVDDTLDENRYAELEITITADGGVNTSKTFTVPVIVSISDYGFADDMENGGDEWTIDGTGQWHISSWNPYEGSQCWRCGDTGSSGHNDNIDQSIITPLVLLEPDKTSGEFSYYINYGLESSYDYGYCDINDGSVWTTLETFNGGDSGGSGWQSKLHDITGYNGSLVQGRFRMTSDGSEQRYGMDIDLVNLGYEGTSDIDVYNFLALFEQGVVNVQWSCTDNDVLGYNLYRREINASDSSLVIGSDTGNETLHAVEKDWERLNDALITGDSPYRFIDGAIEIDTTYRYRLEAVLVSENEDVGTRSVSTAESNIPFTYRLGHSYPNPSTNITHIDFALPHTENVTLKLYDMKGRCVATPVDGELPVGIHSIPVDVSELAGGVYLYRLETPNFKETMKLVVGR
ncbi:MAG: T9SS type A sorting domain-containing protein [bacterium]|nr:T9SS type A sorting domain-containing protein [bacterium]